MATIDLLDTPRRASLTTRSTTLRASIKEWERSFAAAHEGKKPNKSDIKANAEIAAKYKEFQRLGDLLAGKLGLEALQSPRKKQTTDTVRRRLYDLTPRKIKPLVDLHPSQIDPYDAPPSATPKRFLSAIGPTPQRDGKVLGLFDMLSNSGGSRRSKNTPDSQSKKRKIDALTETDGNVVARTPSRRRIFPGGDILQHLASADEVHAFGEKKFERTPASESKKFMLSHFFATPSAVRYANLVGDVETTNTERTPLRSFLLDAGSPEKGYDRAADSHDTTPVFLRRSHSFKERLISTKPGMEALSPSAVRRGPPTLRNYRSAPKPLSQVTQDPQHIGKQQSRAMESDNDDDDDNDAMEAMRETENDVQIQETQPQELSDFEGQGESDLDNAKPVLEREKVWRKKGQKRTTRKSNIKPAVVKMAKAPKYVAAEEGEDDISQVQETQLHNNIAGAASSPNGDSTDDELQALDRGEPDELLEGEENMSDSFQPDDLQALEYDDIPAKKPRTVKSSKETDASHAFKPKKSSRAATINPNAVSHQNFKSLKIRSKTAKPTGAGKKGKFGRKR